MTAYRSRHKRSPEGLASSLLCNVICCCGQNSLFKWSLSLFLYHVFCFCANLTMVSPEYLRTNRKHRPSAVTAHSLSAQPARCPGHRIDGYPRLGWSPGCIFALNWILSPSRQGRVWELCPDTFSADRRKRGIERLCPMDVHRDLRVRIEEVAPAYIPEAHCDPGWALIGRLRLHVLHIGLGTSGHRGRQRETDGDKESHCFLLRFPTLSFTLISPNITIPFKLK